MSAGEILALARAAGATHGARVLDLCCGSGAVAAYLARRCGCRVIGIDHAERPLQAARSIAARCRAGTLQFLRADVTRLPVAGRVDAVLMLETMLAIPEKAPLLRAVSDLLPHGRCFGFTVEEGAPLSARERERMPDGETVWPVPEDELLSLLARYGFRVRLLTDYTAAHARIARRLADAFCRQRGPLAGVLGGAAFDETLVTHRLWAEWLGRGRIRKLAVVVERAGC